MVETVLGFDFGPKKIGLALGQSITGSANPLTILPSSNARPDWAAIERTIREWRPTTLVVGLPLRENGEDSPMSLAARDFIAQLRDRFDLPVHGVNEFLSSHAAAERTGGGKRGVPPPLDAVAAQIIVETWFAEQS